MSFTEFYKVNGASLVDQPDIELVLGAGALTGDISGSLKSIFGFTDEWYEQFFHGYEGLDGFSIVPILLHPKSRGRVTLRSSNPLYWPILEANYYENEEDLKTMVQGIRKVRISSKRINLKLKTNNLFIAYDQTFFLKYRENYSIIF